MTDEQIEAVRTRLETEIDGATVEAQKDREAISYIIRRAGETSHRLPS